MKIDEVVSIYNEKFNLKLLEPFTIDGYNILFRSKNDKYDLSWNVKNKIVDFFENGFKIGYIKSDEEPMLHSYILQSIRYEKDIIEVLEKKLQFLIEKELYEEAELIDNVIGKIT